MLTRFARGFPAFFTGRLTPARRAGLIAAVVAGGLLAAVFYRFVLMGLVLGKPFPCNTFLFRPNDRYNDFIRTWFYLSNGVRPFAQGNGFVSMMPLTILLYVLFALMPLWLGLIIMQTGVIGFTAWFVRKTLPEQAPSWTFYPLAFMTYPLIFLLDRGNLEIFLFGFIALFFLCLERGRYKMASLLLGLAIAMKPFPAVFLALFATKERRIFILWTVFYAAAVSAASLAFLAWAYDFSPWQALITLAETSRKYNEIYNIGLGGLVYTHSLFSMLKLCIYHFYILLNELASRDAIVAAVAKPYFVAACVAYSCAAYFCVVVETTLWKKAALLAVCMLALPFYSPDYRLVHLLIPAMLFINSGESGEFDTAYAWIFGLLLVPKHYLLRIFVMVPPETGIGIIVEPALFCLLAWLIVKERKAGGAGRRI